MGHRWDRIALSIERNERSREAKMDTVHSGKERRKENDINRECRERIHDKISFVVVVVVCLFLFKFHCLLGWQKLNCLPTPKSFYFKGYAKWVRSRVVFRRGVGSPVAKQLSLTISFHTKTRNQQGWGHSKHAQLKYILHFTDYTLINGWPDQNNPPVRIFRQYSAGGVERY